MKITDQKAKTFKDWLEVRGAVVCPPTNPFERIRFIAHNQTSIIYTKKTGHVSAYTGEARAAWEAFTNNTRWDGGHKEGRGGDSKRRYISRMELVERDGLTCVYCGQEFAESVLTIEHFIPLTRGGKDRLYNMLLACSSCNAAVGHMTIREKIEYAIKKRAKA